MKQKNTTIRKRQPPPRKMTNHQTSCVAFFACISPKSTQNQSSGEATIPSGSGADSKSHTKDGTHTETTTQDGSNSDARTSLPTHTSTNPPTDAKHKPSITERSEQRENVCTSLGVRRLYFVRPHCFRFFSTSSGYRGSALALAKRGEYIMVEGINIWASRALFMYSK